ncbi:phage holin family protein [Bifidobacterium callimiconis]|uniref:phage holin family protein n=1 Tax=Bifidobacterium callimiconis TaxID=2306973 RepID=UPI001BDCA749|nr:phage holin family protein [Bifidobacterium callimiconis]MBT1177643.1 phage holin family protein [Bifidobacterium callimiconis]
MTNLAPHNQQDPQKTQVMPVNGVTPNDDMPTQTLDPDRIKTQNAPTETMPPIGVNDDVTAGAVGTPITDTVTNVDSTDDADVNPADPNANALPTQPIIGKPDVTLAGTEYETGDTTRTDDATDTTDDDSASAGGTYDPFAPIGQAGQSFQTGADQATPTGDGQPAAEQPWTQQTQDQPVQNQQPMNPQEAAWSQQQAAAQGYADEAQRNNYPGSGTAAQATAGPQFQNYPGWNQYAPNMGQPYTPKIEYRKGPSTPTIIWGALVALFALGGLGSSWLFGFSMSLSMWTIFAIVALVVMGVTLVVGGVASAMRRKNRKPKA